LFGISCNSEPDVDDYHTELTFTNDTILFDTVFTTIGSVTKSFVVKNSGNKRIDIKAISVENENSYFKLNIDGVSTNKATNIELMPNDSVFIFAQLKIDPQNETNPVLIEDSIVFEMDETSQSVKLIAYGQDVEIIKSAFLETTVWDSKKPYLILDSVYVLPNSTLTIEKGATIYCHKKAKINVFGNIIVNGTIEEPITFRGDRLDEIWEGYKYDYSTPQWDGIAVLPSKRVSSFNHCIIKNATIGFYIGDTNSDEITKVDLQNTIIHNSSFAGIYSINSDLSLTNCQVTNSGVYNIFIIAGGNYNFYHCTIANFFGLDYNTKREEIPCLSITNAVIDGDDVIYHPLTNANFYNCIIDGNLKNEIVFQKMEGVEFNFKFNNCAVKVAESIKDDFNDNFVNCFFNDTIHYLKLQEWNYSFQLDTNSFAIDKGNATYISGAFNTENDIFGKSRLKDGKPDLGAYEFN